jgi:hypothetical protein
MNRLNYSNYSYNFQRCSRLSSGLYKTGSRCIHLLRCNDCCSNFCVSCKDIISYCYECNTKYCINCKDVNYCDRCDFTYCVNCRYIYECKNCNLHLCDLCVLDNDILDVSQLWIEPRPDHLVVDRDHGQDSLVFQSQDKLRKCSCCFDIYCKSCKNMYRCNKTKLLICGNCVIICNMCYLEYNKNYCIGNTCNICKFNIIQNTTNIITTKIPFEILQLIKKYI